MDKPIGIVAKNISLEFEYIFRKCYGDKYSNISDLLRISLYREIAKILECEKVSEINDFITKYQIFDNKSIDEILEANNSKVIESIKGDLCEIIKES